MADVLITPASGIIEFKDGSNNVDGQIELLGTGNLQFTSPGGRLLFDDSQFTSSLYDTSGATGTAGQILSSTGTGVDWIDASSISGGDANTLDGLDSTQFLRSDVADTAAGLITFTAIPAFNGGTSGSTAPFTVDSNTVVTNLNADLLDGENLVDSAATASTVVGRDGSGDIFARLVRQTFGDQATISGGMVFRVNNSTDNYLRVCNDTSAIRTYLNVPTRTGGDASGTWGINITGSSASTTGNAATATTLQTARTIWGQSFNGSANISGNLTSVGNITGTGAITITAGGTNTSITLTPNGTGTVNAPTFNATSGGFQGIAADSAGSPSFTWTGDLDTGMYRVGTDVIGFTAGGSLITSINLTEMFHRQDLYISNNADTAATSGTTTIDSERLYFRGKYWNGTSSQNGEWSIFNDMDGTGPNSNLTFTWQNLIKLTIDEDGVISAPGSGYFSGSLSGNATTATYLSTITTLWGQSFNGSANVSGALSGATTITASSDISLGGELNFTTASNKYIDFYTDNDAGALSTVYLRLVNNGSTTFHSGITMTRGGAVTLYHNNSQKLETSSTGVSITGTATATTFSGSGESLTSLNASNLSSGTVPDARISGSYTGLTNLTGSGTATFGTFSGSGASLTSLNASNLSSGAVPDARISGSYTGLTNLTGSGTATFGTFSASTAYRCGTTSNDPTGGNISNGSALLPGMIRVSRNDADGNAPVEANRNANGRLCNWLRNGTIEGNISNTGGTVTYAAFLGTHWGRLQDNSESDILIGTILESVDEMMEWLIIDVEIGDEIKQLAYQGPYHAGDEVTVEHNGVSYTGIAYLEGSKNPPEKISDGDELNKHTKVKISDTVSSKCVYGVFVSWDHPTQEYDNMLNAWKDILVGAIGNYFIRIAPGQTPERGDLIESNGDGCGRVQDDDIVRSKTVGKITSAIPQRIYDDGSFLLPAVLYCG